MMMTQYVMTHDMTHIPHFHLNLGLNKFIKTLIIIWTFDNT